MLYFQFLQTVAAFIVQAIKIDSNKDGEISGAEIRGFFVGVIIPLFMNVNGLRNQWQGFYDYIKDLSFEDFKKSLMDIVAGQLLPSELADAEEKIDKIAKAIFNLINSIEDTLEAFKDVFGKKEIQVKLVKK